MFDFEKTNSLLKSERLPAALVDLDAFDRNTQKLLELVKQSGRADVKIRIATKSIRVPSLIKRVLESSSLFQGVMCFSAAEVEYLSSQGISDLYLAYPVTQEADLNNLKTALSRGHSVKVAVDSEEHLKILSTVFNDSSQRLGVVFDMDLSLRFWNGVVHLGVRRSPLRSTAQIFALYEKLLNYSGLKFQGVMGYEAQVAGLTDQNPFTSLINPIKGWIRNRSAALMFEKRKDVHDYFNERNIKIPFFNGGGTGSFNWALKEFWLTEVTAGSGLFQSHLFDYYSNIRFEPSCYFACSVVRKSDASYRTVFGGGYIASGEIGVDRLPIPVFPKNLKLISTEGCGEVQTPLQVGNQKISLGEVVFFRHAKAGELMERFNEVLLIQSGKITSRAKTYRGLGFSFG